MAKRAPREQPPHAQVRALERRLESETSLPPLVVLRGEEAYFRQRALDALQARARALEADVVVHDGSDPDFQADMLLADLAGAPMFASSQLVVARGVESLLTKSGKEQAPLTRGVLAALESGAPGRCIAIAVDSLRADHPLAKAAAEHGALLGLRRLYDSPPPWNPDPRQTELVQWTVERARELGLRLDPARALFVAVATGNDLSALDDQLERLRHSPGGADAIQWQAAGSPFAAADAMCRGDLPRALAALETLRRGGMQGRDGARVVDLSALIAILMGALLRGVRQGLAGARRRAAGGDPADVVAGGGPGRQMAAAELGERLARRPDPEVWRRMLGDLLEVDRRLKGGGGADLDDLVALALAWRVEPTAGVGARP
jgi:DNA polymerase III delta subunit